MSDSPDMHAERAEIANDPGDIDTATCDHCGAHVDLDTQLHASPRPGMRTGFHNPADREPELCPQCGNTVSHTIRK